VPGSVQLLEHGEVTTSASETIDGIAAASSLTDGQYCYELRVPLALLARELAEDAATYPASVSLGLEIGGLTTDERQQQRRHSGSPGGGFTMNLGGVRIGRGGDARGGRGERSGGPGHGSAGRDEMAIVHGPALEPVWLTVKLPSG